MYSLGIDLGSSSVKASLLEITTGKGAGAVFYPKQEMPMISKETGWAEQDPEIWWDNLQKAIKELLETTQVPGSAIRSIGISYQMHGLVLVDKKQEVLRPSIIWCDSRAVEIGNQAFQELGSAFCLNHLLNSPGNFTASKLKWVKDHEPELFKQINKFMLPGDYIAMKLSGVVNSTISGLSEGIFWDFKGEKISQELLDHYGIPQSMVPEAVDTFCRQSEVSQESASLLGLEAGTPIAYRAGDQPNNALSLNVLNPGEIAATAGTSAVIYGINAQPEYDPPSRVNTFVHVNHQSSDPRYGVLLCINGAGILNSWLKNNLGFTDYNDMNQASQEVPIGAEGVSMLPFGNGAERVLENITPGAQLHGLSLNSHHRGHMLRAAQEGIVFAMNYGLNVMKSMGIKVDTIRAGNANMFLSPVFKEAFVNTTGAELELLDTDGALGAARGAGYGAGIYPSIEEAFEGLATLDHMKPSKDKQAQYEAAYQRWEGILKHELGKFQ